MVEFLSWLKEGHFTKNKNTLKMMESIFVTFLGREYASH